MATKATKKAPAKKAAAKPVDRSRIGGAVSPVNVTQNEVKDQGDAIYGHFASVTKGEHEGRYGVVTSFVEFDEKDGYPTKAVLTTRDADNLRLVVDYDALKRDRPGKF